MIKIIFLFATIVALNENHICTCFPVTIQESIKKSDVIFRGKVLKVDTLSVIPESFINAKLATPDSGAFVTGHLVSLEIRQILKGENRNDTIQIMTGEGNGDCGYYFKLNKEYLVYADRQQYYLVYSIDKLTSKFRSHLKEYFTTNDCDRTTDEVKKEEELLKTALRTKN